MAISTFCINTSCWCTVHEVGDACCADCEQDARRAVPGACGCGHSECEPKGLELDSEIQKELALPV